MLIALAVVMLILLDYWPVTQAYGVVHTYLEQDAMQAYQTMEALPDQGRYWVPFQLARPGLHYTDTSYGARYTGRAHVSDNGYHLMNAPSRAALLLGQGLKGEMEADRSLSSQARAILDLSNVRYLLLHLWPEEYESSLDGLTQDPSWALLEQGQHIAVLENRAVRPYAHAYAGGLLVTAFDQPQANSLPDLLHKGYALVERVGRSNTRGPSRAPLLRLWDEQTATEAAMLHAPQVELAMSRPASTEIWIRYEAREPFLLMISETWYPHWDVYVNGERGELLRINGNFQGVYVDGLEGRVLFRYRRPWYIWPSRAVSFFSLIGLLAYLLRPQPVRLRPGV